MSAIGGKAMNVSWAALVVSALIAIWGFMQLG